MMKPSIAKYFACAAVFHDWQSVMVELHRGFMQRGGIVERYEVTGFIHDDATVIGVESKFSKSLNADQTVVAACAWSKKLAAELGLNLQLEGVIGYQTKIKAPENTNLTAYRPERF